jgi:glutathione synthase/RimK-type ligase-like ATP-grasp enzyme
MSKVKVLPYTRGSKSAKAIVQSLNPRAILKKETTPLKGKKTLINWGKSSIQFSTVGATILNKPEAVRIASNKLSALTVMKDAGIKVCDFTTDIEQAKEWIENDRWVLCRTLLRSNSGKGIVIAKELEQLVTAPLYTKYIRKSKEYRVHVFKGEVIDFVEKKKRSGYNEDTPGFNKYIRSYEQGWVMVKDGVTLPDSIKEQSISAVNALGLDFGAVDVVVSSYDNTSYVLEINTAPGLQGRTVVSYKRAIERWLTNV